MKLLAVNILLCCILLAKATQSDVLTDVPNTLVCPETSGVTLVSTSVSGCKVHYICEDGKYKVLSKLYKCSESQIMTGKIQDCQEKPECPGLDIIKQSETLEIISESISQPEPSNRDLNKRDLEERSPIETTLDFFKCLFEVSNVDQFTKKCMDSEMFLRQSFIEMDSPKVMEYVSGLMNASQVTGYEASNDGNHSVEDALKALITYLAPQCEVECKRSRVKRSATESMSEDKYRLLTSKDIKSISKNNGTGFTEQVLVPIVLDIANDENAMANLTQMFRIIIDAAVPLVKEILEFASEDSMPGQRSILKIRRKTYDELWEKIDSEAYPIFRQLMELKFSPIMELWSRNVNVMIDSFHEMGNRMEHRYMDLFYKGVELFFKYSSTYQNSTAEYIQTYSLTEMRKDIESVISILTKESKESIRNNLYILLEATGITKEDVTEFFTNIGAKYPGIIATIIENFLFFLNYFL